MIKAVIFDLDGLLANTEILHFKAYQKILGNYGYELTMDFYSDFWIRQGKTIRNFVSEKNFPHKATDLHNLKIVQYLKLIDAELTPMPHAIEAVEWLTRKYKSAIATSSFLVGAGEVLKKLKIYDKFDIICTRDDITNLKPHPDIFLLAAERLGVTPDQCVVLEDAEKGIEAAHRAGMKSIAIPSEHTHDNDFSKATIKLNSLEEVTEKNLSDL